MPESKDVVEVVTTPAEVPAKPAPEPVEKPVETEDSFVDEAIGPVPEPKAEVTEEQLVEETPEPEAPTVAPEVKKEEVVEPIKVEPEAQVETPKVEERRSGLDIRISKEYEKNFILKGEEAPSAEAIEAELVSMSVEEKRNAIRNLVNENRSLQGKKPEPLSHEDEEAIIEAEVNRRYQVEQQAIFEQQAQEDLIATLSAHPELDIRTKYFNPKIERAVSHIVKSGILASEAYAIVLEVMSNAKEAIRKNTEIESQKAMSGAVVSQPISEVINKEPETDEEKFLADALG